MTKTEGRRETPIASFVINRKLHKSVKDMTRRMNRGSPCAISTSMLIRALIRVALHAEAQLQSDDVTDESELVAALKTAIKKTATVK